MKHLDLFSGIGGFALAARWVGWETIGFCEPDEYCCAVLRKHWPDVPIYPDVRELKGEAVGSVDIITGGYPCQPFSTAARGRNTATDLWPAFLRVIQEVRPIWVVAENVPRGLEHIDRAARDLQLENYRTRTIDVALTIRKHTRRRAFIVAYTNGYGKPQCSVNAEASRIPKIARHWRDEPDPMGMDDGLPPRMDRLRALGNAIVPQVAEVIFQAIEASQ